MIDQKDPVTSQKDPVIDQNDPVTSQKNPVIGQKDHGRNLADCGQDQAGRRTRRAACGNAPVGDLANPARSPQSEAVAHTQLQSSKQPDALLSAHGLAVDYGKVNALSPLDIAVAPGQIVTVIGANGAGKSTLLNALMGALPARGRSRGQVRFMDQDVSNWDIERRVGQGLCLVPERRELFASMTVRENLLLGGFRQYRAGTPAWRDTLDEVYALFPRLQERAHQAAGTLSGGEQQMLAVGRALMARPALLMLDEPSLGLAPRVVREIFLTIAQLRRAGVSILLVEQNARAALRVADYGYVLETGEVILHAAAAELADHPRVVESYLGLGRAGEAR